MPSSNTLTAFYTFQAGSTARSADVNANFTAYRGHVFAVDPNTLTAAVTNTYDLGSSDHRWGVGYYSAMDLSITTTAQMIVQGLSSGGWDFRKNGTSLFSVVDDGYVGILDEPMTVYNPTAPAGNIAARSTQNVTLSSSQHVPNTTCTIQCTGRPVKISLEGNSTASPNWVELVDASATVQLTKIAELCFVIDGIRMPGYVIANLRETTTKTITIKPPKYPGNTFFMIDTPTPGYHTYSLYVSMGSNTIVALNNVRLLAREIGI
jgi:hypothetical protein